MEHISITTPPHRENCRYIHLSNEYFPEREVVIDINSEYLVIRIPSLDDAKTFKAYHHVKGINRIAIGAELPTGKFLIDQEESNEDQLVIYFEDEI